MKRGLFFPILLFVFPFIVSAQSTAKEWFSKGIELKGKQDYKGALAAFKNAISKKADYNEAYYQAGWCCNELENYEDAVGFLKKFIPTKDADKKNKYNETGFSYYKLQKATESIIEYKNAIALSPNDGIALRGLGNVYYEIEEDYDSAIEYFEKAIKEDEEDSKPIYYKLGWLYNDKERYDDAIKILLKAIEYDSEDSGYREELGYAYFQKQEYEFALTQLNKAISLDDASKLG
ncbi:MAG TPA: tetratricopeptide repeat protein, partial [Chitinophagaceae bacterium]|nr:tetratricopeptide repeat protein [Chitinophagaceae bacterium]